MHYRLHIINLRWDYFRLYLFIIRGDEKHLVSVYLFHGKCLIFARINIPSISFSKKIWLIIIFYLFVKLKLSKQQGNSVSRIDIKNIAEFFIIQKFRREEFEHEEEITIEDEKIYIYIYICTWLCIEFYTILARMYLHLSQFAHQEFMASLLMKGSLHTFSLGGIKK